MVNIACAQNAKFGLLLNTLCRTSSIEHTYHQHIQIWLLQMILTIYTYTKYQHSVNGMQMFKVQPKTTSVQQGKHYNQANGFQQWTIYYWPFPNAATCSGFTDTPSPHTTTWAWNVIFFQKRLNFPWFSFKLDSCGLWNTRFRFSRWSFMNSSTIMTSLVLNRSPKKFPEVQSLLAIQKLLVHWRGQMASLWTAKDPL